MLKTHKVWVQAMGNMWQDGYAYKFGNEANESPSTKLLVTRVVTSMLSILGDPNTNTVRKDRHNTLKTIRQRTARIVLLAF